MFEPRTRPCRKPPRQLPSRPPGRVNQTRPGVKPQLCWMYGEEGVRRDTGTRQRKLCISPVGSVVTTIFAYRCRLRRNHLTRLWRTLMSRQSAIPRSCSIQRTEQSCCTANRCANCSASMSANRSIVLAPLRVVLQRTIGYTHLTFQSAPLRAGLFFFSRRGSSRCLGYT